MYVNSKTTSSVVSKMMRWNSYIINMFDSAVNNNRFIDDDDGDNNNLIHNDEEKLHKLCCSNGRSCEMHS